MNGPSDDDFDKAVEGQRNMLTSTSSATVIPFRTNAELDAQTVRLDDEREKRKIPAPAWPDLTDKGEPKRTYRNARAAINALGITCRNDEFHGKLLVGGEPIQQWAGELSDDALTVLRQMIVQTFSFDPGKDHVSDAATALCLENRFNPILDYLDGLKWDGTSRLDTWLMTYMGAADTPLHRAIGRLTLLAAVRRVRQPGCKFDQIPVLEGPEGIEKSTAIATLAGVENFSDQTILTQSDKEQQELLRGVWIYEIADMAGMKRSEVEKVKAFASRTHDRARPAYGRRRIDAPRRCVLIGTTNDDTYLKSTTGNRRFWPVKVEKVDIDALRRDRDQIWAEAAALEAEGVSLVLPRELWAVAAVAQDERRESDPWDDVLASITGELYADGEWIKASQVLAFLGIPTASATNTHSKRAAASMRANGWKADRHYFGTAKQHRGYVRRQDSKTDDSET
jgi:predicted P-loop ATPase